MHTSAGISVRYCARLEAAFYEDISSDACRRACTQLRINELD